MKQIIFLLGFLLLGFSSETLAQSSVEEVFKSLNGLADTIKIEQLDSIAIANKKKEPEFSMNLSRKAISLSDLIKHDKYSFFTRTILWKTYRDQGEFDAAIQVLDSAAIYANRLGGKYPVILNDKYGLTYMRSGEYKQSADYFFKAIKQAEALPKREMLAEVTSHIGSLFFYQENFNNAITYYRKSYHLYLDLENFSSAAFATDNVGLCYSNLEKFDSAFYYQNASVKLLEKLDDKVNLAVGYNNLGTTLMLMSDFKQAQSYFMKALKLNEEINDKYGLLNSYRNLGELNLKTKDFSRSINYLEKAYELSKELQIPSQLKYILSDLANSYNASGKYREAALAYEELVSISDSLFREETVNSINELNTKYETEKKQQAIALLTKEKEADQIRLEKERSVKFFSVAIAFMLFIVAGVLFYRFSEKKKANQLLEEKNHEILEQKEEIESQRDIIEERNKEVLDSIRYAQYIQSSILPSARALDQFFPEIKVYFQPRDIVSGDFYWMAKSGDTIFFAVADCTGHGVPGAMMSMMGASLLNQIVLEKKISTPALILAELHHLVIRNLNEDITKRNSKDGMDIALIAFKPDQNKLIYSGAGRPLVIIHNGESNVIKADKAAIGGYFDTEEVKFTDHELSIEKGMTLWMYSDGVVDQFGGPDGKKFMSGRLQKSILAKHDLTLSDIYIQITSELEEWKSGHEQTDDITLAMIRF